jgi:hypothetical protein
MPSGPSCGSREARHMDVVLVLGSIVADRAINYISERRTPRNWSSSGLTASPNLALATIT